MKPKHRSDQRAVACIQTECNRLCNWVAQIADRIEQLLCSTGAVFRVAMQIDAQFHYVHTIIDSVFPDSMEIDLFPAHFEPFSPLRAVDFKHFLFCCASITAQTANRVSSSYFSATASAATTSCGCYCCWFVFFFIRHSERIWCVSGSYFYTFIFIFLAINSESNTTDCWQMPFRLTNIETHRHIWAKPNQRIEFYKCTQYSRGNWVWNGAFFIWCASVFFSFNGWV